MVVRAALMAVMAALAGVRALHVSDEPVNTCHTRAAGVDSAGRHVVTFTDHTREGEERQGDRQPSPVSESVGSAVAILNAALSAVQLQETSQGDIQIIAVDTGTVGRTDLSCEGDGNSGRSTIRLNTRYWEGLETPEAQHDRLVAVLHEFGHALGLAHAADPCVVMHPSNSDCPPPREIRFTTSEAETIDDLYRSGNRFRPRALPTAPYDSNIFPAPWPRY